MTTKHTPGPWYFDNAEDVDLPNHVGISAEEHGLLAQVVWRMEDDERTPRCEANAHLIVAAPDLLKALVKIASLTQTKNLLWWQKEARAAIAKATGKPADLEDAPRSNGEFTLEQIEQAKDARAAVDQYARTGNPKYLQQAMELLKQPEALRLAELLEQGPCRSGDTAIAAELRRLHAENAQLRATLETIARMATANVNPQATCKATT